ncbi:signal peptidase I [Candidatus Dependentiae bacterium]|nr:signal peptidase I [Candidatus Dependentiae bacterium]
MNILKRLLGDWYEIKTIRIVAELVFVILPIAFLIRTVGFGLYQVPSGSMETTLLVGERFFADKFSYWLRKPKHGEIIAFNDPKHLYSSNSFVNLMQRYVSFNVSNWTKRVIGIPGDVIRGTIENGHPVVFRNGEKLDESGYVNKYPLIMLRKEQIRKRNCPPFERNIDWRSYNPSVAWDKQLFYKINPQLIVQDPKTMKPQYILEPGTPQFGGIDIFEVKLGENQYWVMGDNRLGSCDSRDWGILDGKLIHGKIIFRIWSMDTTESYWFIDLLKSPLKFWEKVRWGRCLQWVQ